MPSTPRSREHGGQAVAGADGHEAVALLSGAVSGSAAALRHGLQLGFHVLQIVGALHLAAGGQILGLSAHVLDLGQLQRAVLLGLGQRVAGDVRCGRGP